MSEVILNAQNFFFLIKNGFQAGAVSYFLVTEYHK